MAPRKINRGEMYFLRYRDNRRGEPLKVVYCVEEGMNEITLEEIKSLSEEIYAVNVKNGWHKELLTVPEVCSLLHSEVSEAVEEFRNSRPPVYYITDVGEVAIETDIEEWIVSYKAGLQPKPEGELIEIADAVIRLLDFVKSRPISIPTIEFYTFEEDSNIRLYAELHLLISELYKTSQEFTYPSHVVWILAACIAICNKNGWNLWAAVRLKLEYNKTREWRHGGKRL